MKHFIYLLLCFVLAAVLFAGVRFYESRRQPGLTPAASTKLAVEPTRSTPVPSRILPPLPNTAPSPAPTPAPVVSLGITPTPQLAATPDAISFLIKHPLARPKEVTLLVSTQFSVVINGIPHGVIDAVPGTLLTVTGMEPGYVDVTLGSAAQRLPTSSTDLAARAPKATREFLAREQIRVAFRQARPAEDAPPRDTRVQLNDATAPAIVNTSTQLSTGFEAGTPDPLHTCTVQAPNYGKVVTLDSEHLHPAARTGNCCLKLFWTEEGYNGTRMRRGTEACEPLDTFKEGWSGFYLYLPDPGYPMDKEAACAQVFQHGACNSWAATLVIKKNTLCVNHRHNCGNPTSAEVAHDIPRNRWVPIVIHFVASHEGRGCFQVWFDADPQGSPSYNATNINFGFGTWNSDDTLATDSSIGAKWGQYDYDDHNYTKGETRTSYYDNLCFLTGHSAAAWSRVHPAAAVGSLDASQSTP